MKLTNTPVENLLFSNREIYIKRDDLLHPEFSGNKARKFGYFLEHDFPEIMRLIGYGSAQANSLYSLSALAKLKGWQLDYYVDHIATHMTVNPAGNYAGALKNGANIISLSELANSKAMDCATYITTQVLPQTQGTLFVPEGGRCHYAEYGVNQLGAEIWQWSLCQGIKNLILFLPSGTGTTALFLQKYFMSVNADIRVYTCAVVGDKAYLVSQFNELCTDKQCHPQILALPKKYHFGKLYAEFYHMWHQVNQSGIEFELLYDPLGFMTLEAHLSLFKHSPVMYIHQGGLLGNETMLPRYVRKYGKLD